MKKYLVSNIKFDAEVLDINVPEFLLGSIALKEYLRTYFMKEAYLDFDWQEEEHRTTLDEMQQPFNLDMQYETFGQPTVTLSVRPMHISSMIVTLGDDDLKGYGDDIDLAIIIKLQCCLPMDFIYDILPF